MSADETNLASARHSLRTHCIGCGCHDMAACWDEPAGQPCHWLAVDRRAQLGVCSACPEDLARWRSGDREVLVPLEIELPTPRPAARKPSCGQRSRATRWQAEQTLPVKMTPALRRQAHEALALPWLGKVTRSDLRFGHEGEEALAGWIRSCLQAETVPPSFPALLDQLLKADSLTAEGEARELALQAARKCAPRSGGEEALLRRVSMLMRRHLNRTGAGRSLAEVGAEFGVTKERVRAVCEALENQLAASEMVTPALDRVLQAVTSVAPVSVNALDERLRCFIGDDTGIESLVSWAAVLGRQTTAIKWERVRTQVRGHLVEATMVQAEDAPPWIDALMRHVGRDSSMFGCTNLLRVAGRLALKEGVAPGQEAIESALEAVDGFRWLDKQAGWFTLGDSSGCSAATRVRKIIAVAHDTIGTDEIAGALASDDMWMYRELASLGLATPPVHVLRELFLGWPWLKVVQRGRFVAGPGFDPTGVLSDVEQAIVHVITAHDGVACRYEFKEVVSGQLGLTDMPLSATLGSSPIVERIEQGIYRLRGRRFGDDALKAARQRLRERERATPQGASPAEVEPNEFLVRVTAASLKSAQYHVPTRFCAALIGKRHKAICAEGNALGEVRVHQSGALAGLHKLFPDAQPGDHFRVEVMQDRLRVRLCSPMAR
jgi:hypothetical protein